MKNQQLKLNSLIIIVAILLTFVFVGGESNAFALQKPAVQTTTASDNVNTQSLKSPTIPQKNAYDMTHMQKNGFQYGIFKFLMAMLGVVVSGGAIFFGLKLYQKIVLKSNAKFDNIDYDKTLESPKDFKEAINIFLEKTDKDK